eukprot:COSAG06_NODE_1450_length_9437_cov_5.045299_14_plen_84_part_00
MTIPHWVETFDEPALTLTLVHSDLRHNGELCPHGQDRERYLTGITSSSPQPVVPSLELKSSTKGASICGQDEHTLHSGHSSRL